MAVSRLLLPTSWTLLRRRIVALGVLAAIPIAVVGLTRGDGVPQVNAAKLPPGRPVTLAWAGDTTLGSSFGLPSGQGFGLLRAVAPLLKAADLTAVNLEGTLSTGGSSKCASGASRANCFAFRAPPRNARALRRAGVDIVNLANNHAFDFGAIGLGQTVSALRAARVAQTGRPFEVRVLAVDGAKVAFVGFSTYPWSSPMGDAGAVRLIVAGAAKQANLVVVVFHAGAEGSDRTHVPRGAETAFGEDRGDSRVFARQAIDAGADLVVGSGPHVLRGMELYRGRLIAYSLGNLAGYKNFATGGTLSLARSCGRRSTPTASCWPGGWSRWRSAATASRGSTAREPRAR